ncbi:TadE family protein [Allobranchiibius sp. CTAmp26]|uniref:TadE family protein n=1 Tax=Allobranchiibius sp. CTAmp26 TaxID=2815214 RepID=UPI001AA19769|nr:TadE family protein [Allobranchiibius sp. CTAmp26]MBO1756467.1 pilus assembly protein [Allobranchiibius sp. CTAmp26]
MRRATAHHRLDEGSAAIEAAIGVPAFMLFVLLVIFGGRVALAHEAVQSAAADAARSASLARTPGQAQHDGTSRAAMSLSAQSVHCVSQEVSVDTSGFAAPVGTPATVTAKVRCTVDLSDVSVPGVPGSMTITETTTSPLDTYRQR